MERQVFITFSVSKVGASHLPKGIPCQDYSLMVADDDMRMVVVCDGHGSKTYVRSDVGSRLAAEITKEMLEDFVKKTPAEIFLNKKGAVTARPTVDDTLWGALPDKSVQEMTEIEQMIYMQNKEFFRQVKDIREQDTILMALFTTICSKWLKAIEADCEKNPFSEEEKAALGKHSLVKAYGSTLMAYVQTKDYWLAFQIGDGRIVEVSNWMEMTAPVPWDCNCFLNITTSLCNSNPIRMFRYAFDGTGHFPAAVLCCSDGIEDSFGDYTLAPYYLHNWYRGLLGKFVTEGEQTTLKNLDDFLPVLSQKGSHDDVSLAGVINTEAVAKGIKFYELSCKIEEINKQESELRNEKKLLMEQLDELKTDIDSDNVNSEPC